MGRYAMFYIRCALHGSGGCNFNMYSPDVFRVLGGGNVQAAPPVVVSSAGAVPSTSLILPLGTHTTMRTHTTRPQALVGCVACVLLGAMMWTAWPWFSCEQSQVLRSTSILSDLLPSACLQRHSLAFLNLTTG